MQELLRIWVLDMKESLQILSVSLRLSYWLIAVFLKLVFMGASFENVEMDYV